MTSSMHALPARIGRVDRLRPLGGQAARFLAVGVAGLSLDSLAFLLLHRLGLDDALARAVSLAAATLLTWRLNRAFTFAASRRRSAEEAGRYALVVLLAQGVSYAVFLLARALAPWAPPLIALWFGAAVAALFSFTGQRLFTFTVADARA